MQLHCIQQHSVPVLYTCMRRLWMAPHKPVPMTDNSQFFQCAFNSFQNDVSSFSSCHCCERKYGLPQTFPVLSIEQMRWTQTLVVFRKPSQFFPLNKWCERILKHLQRPQYLRRLQCYRITRQQSLKAYNSFHWKDDVNVTISGDNHTCYPKF